jgi:hypothetical protein
MATTIEKAPKPTWELFEGFFWGYHPAYNAWFMYQDGYSRICNEISQARETFSKQKQQGLAK